MRVKTVDQVANQASSAQPLIAAESQTASEELLLQVLLSDNRKTGEGETGVFNNEKTVTLLFARLIFLRYFKNNAKHFRFSSK